MVYSAVEISPTEIGATRADGSSWVQYLAKREATEPQRMQFREMVLAQDNQPKRQQEPTKNVDNKVSYKIPEENIVVAMGQADNRYNRDLAAGMHVRSSAHAVKEEKIAAKAADKVAKKAKTGFVTMVMGQGHGPKGKKHSFVGGLGYEKKEFSSFRSMVAERDKVNAQVHHGLN